MGDIDIYGEVGGVVFSVFGHEPDSERVPTEITTCMSVPTGSNYGYIDCVMVEKIFVPACGHALCSNLRFVGCLN